MKPPVRAISLPALFLAALAGGTGLADVVDFDDLALAPESHWNGPDPGGTVVDGPFGDLNVGRFTSRDAQFVNRYDLTYGSWDGFSYSNMSDTTTPGYGNQFSAFAGGGRGPGADIYGVATGYQDLAPNLYDPVPFDPSDPDHLAQLPYLTLPAGRQVEGLYVTNTTYTALAIRDGLGTSGFSKKFGGPTGDDPDWFKLTAYGTDAAGRPLGTSAEFYLADYRAADDYVVSDWRFFDLGTLAGARTIYFNLSSSDVDADNGMNTPAYFAVDDIQLRAVPEPAGGTLVAVGLAILAVLARRGHPDGEPGPRRRDEARPSSDRTSLARP